VESNGWFSAIKLIVRISGPGHNLPLISTPDRTTEVLDHSETCQPIYSSFSASAVIGVLRHQRRH